MSQGPRVSVVMPTYNQAAFLGRAIRSLLGQSMADWELVIVDDGSTDGTSDVVRQFLTDSRITYLRTESNAGLGCALNAGLDRAAGPYIAYLPSDDVYFPEHLTSLLSCMSDSVGLAWSGVKHHDGELGSGKTALDAPSGFPLQLVQVMHPRTKDRWTERADLETDDLDELFWAKLRKRGETARTGIVTCEWVDHPDQRHKAIREWYGGGLNVFRSRYRVPSPLRFRSSDSSLIDEVRLYERFRRRPPATPGTDSLKVLLVGDLGHNPERILALEERGHQLYGLWTPDGLRACTVGPVPFGHIQDVPRENWRQVVRELRPDVIYGLLNYLSVPFVHSVLEDNPGVPFVWHFKEGPHRCIARGTWRQLADLYTRSDAAVYFCEEAQEWFEQALPRPPRGPTIVLDGDLPKREWFTTPSRQGRLSDSDGEIHTVVLGRPLGMNPALISDLANRGVHVHIYGLVRGVGLTREWTTWLDDAQRLAPRHLHLHPHLAQDEWVQELSRYDAGWLHSIRSRNGGDLHKVTWDDLNRPTRIPPLLAAGVPLIERANPSCIVTTQNLIERNQVGILYKDLDDLCGRLTDRTEMRRHHQAIASCWEEFTFDYHVERLEALLREVAS